MWDLLTEAQLEDLAVGDCGSTRLARSRSLAVVGVLEVFGGARRPGNVSILFDYGCGPAAAGGSAGQS